MGKQWLKAEGRDTNDEFVRGAFVEFPGQETWDAWEPEERMTDFITKAQKVLTNKDIHSIYIDGIYSTRPLIDGQMRASGIDLDTAELIEGGYLAEEWQHWGSESAEEYAAEFPADNTPPEKDYVQVMLHYSGNFNELERASVAMPDAATWDAWTPVVREQYLIKEAEEWACPESNGYGWLRDAYLDGRIDGHITKYELMMLDRGCNATYADLQKYGYIICAWVAYGYNTKDEWYAARS